MSGRLVIRKQEAFYYPQSHQNVPLIPLEIATINKKENNKSLLGIGSK